MWRIRSYKELREMLKDLDLVTDIKKKERLKWIGYVIKMDQGNTFNKLFGSS